MSLRGHVLEVTFANLMRPPTTIEEPATLEPTTAAASSQNRSADRQPAPDTSPPLKIRPDSPP